MRPLSTQKYFAVRLLVFVALVAIPLLVALGYLLTKSFASAKASAEAQLVSQARNGAREVQAVLARAESTLDFLRAREEVLKGDWDGCGRLLTGLLQIDASFHNLWVATPDGDVVCSSLNPERKSVNFSKEPWFLKALSGPPLYVLGTPGKGELFPRFRAPLLTRVDDEKGHPLAVVSVSLNLEAISAKFRAGAVSDSHAVTLVDTDAFVYARSHFPEKLIGTKLPRQVTKLLATPKGQLFEEVGPDEQRRLYTGYPVDKYNLYVASGLPATEVFAVSEASAYEAAGALAIAIVLSFGLAFYGARRLTEPLKALADVAKKQAAGSRSARAPNGLASEFGEVAREFNAMLDAAERTEKMLRYSEGRAQRLAEMYSALSETNQAIGRVKDAQSLYDVICATCVTSSHAKMAWIGLVDGTKLTPTAFFGPFKDFSDGLTVDLDGTSAASQGPAATAARTNEAVAVGDMWVDPSTAYWLDNCKRFGVRSIAAVPFSKGDKVVGVLTVYMQEPDFFDEALVGLLQEMALSISFALEYWDRREEQRLAELATQAALRAKAKAEARDSAKTQFLTRMGHELRTPLNAILGFAQMLQERSSSLLDEKGKKQLQLIFKAGTQLRLLLDDALDVARIESGELLFSPQEVDPKDLLDDSRELLSPLAEDAGVAVNCTCGADVVPLLVTDPDRLRQVLMNLLSLSIRRMSQGGTVRLSANATAGALILSVEDNGPPLTEEQLTKIYEPFKTGTMGFQSLDRIGLGMLLTRQLVEMIGGRMTVDSEDGLGTRVRVLLPKLNTLTAPALVPTEQSSTLLAEQGTVLYIEDNNINAALVKEALEPWPNIRVMVASTGEQGLEMIQKRRPDLVLLDMQLPGMSGLEVLTQLRGSELTQPVKVVVLSAVDLPVLKTKTKEAGALAYWMKPIDFPQLVNGVRKYLAA